MALECPLFYESYQEAHFYGGQVYDGARREYPVRRFCALLWGGGCDF